MNTAYGDYSLRRAHQRMDEFAQKAERRRLVTQARRENRGIGIEDHRSSPQLVSVRWVRGLIAAALHTLAS